MKRHPVVADGLSNARDCIPTGSLSCPGREPRDALDSLLPCGYVYSGAIAGETFARVNIPERVVLLGPNHTGNGRSWAVYSAGSWLTPLGECPIDENLAALILVECPGTQADEQAHRFEHSLEVQIPFVQRLAPQAQIVPICLGGGTLAELLLLGKSLGAILASYPRKTLIVASSDMTHYEPGRLPKKKDRKLSNRF